MSTVKASVSRYSLTVDVTETLKPLFEAAQNEHGERLLDALVLGTGPNVPYVAPPDRNVTAEDLRLDADPDPDLPCVANGSAFELLQELANAGYVSVRTEMHESSADSYLSEGRTITTVQVLKPFVVLTARQTFSPVAERRLIEFGCAYPDRCEIADRSEVVPAGWYLLGEVEDVDHPAEPVGVAGMDELPDDVVAWLFELEGFGATTCLAGCATCSGSWIAESGTWTFHPDNPRDFTTTWAFDDADDFMTDSIACPACRTGRVWFVIC